MSTAFPTHAPPPPRPGSRSYDVEQVRAAFPVLGQRVNGNQLVYLDNAASSQKPWAVLDAMEHYYRCDNANVHRGIHELASRATDAYEAARVRVAAFLGIGDPGELIWTSGTTQALNLVASAWGGANLRPGDEILLSVLEHHSNLVPWQMVAARTGARLRFIDIDEQGVLDLSRIDQLVNERTRVVSIGHVSNALGTVNPVRRLAGRAHRVGAIMVVDGAQSAPHLAVDIGDLECDFFAFSGHKMCGPTGIGGLWGRRELLEAMPPLFGGGDMIDHVELESATWAELPNLHEAGTPNIAGAVGLGAAVDYLDLVGRERIEAHGRALLAYALRRVAEVPDIRLYGPADLAQRSGVLSFTLGDVHPHDLATILNDSGIAIRAGHHCAQPLMRRLGVPALARASFYLYNTTDEVDLLVEGLHRARGLFGL